MFQFPTNGKVHLNACGHRRQSVLHCFNSLRTGKYIWTLSELSEMHRDIQVSIPYERESTSEPANPAQTVTHIKSFNSLRTGKYIWTVEGSLVQSLFVLLEGFNSLRTGKYIWTAAKRCTVKTRYQKFQFPTNGKVHLNGTDGRHKTYQRRFNSLRTGKYIWTVLYRTGKLGGE